MSDSKLPKPLIDGIKDGNIILFLGAGAAFDSIHKDGKKPPTGTQLADLIAEKFLSSDYLGKDLQYVSELAISETDLFKVQKFVADIFIEFKPGEHHNLIPMYKWHSIYTTNYDLIIEEAYERNHKKQQELATFVKNGERIIDKMIFPNSVMYNKLHGSITDIDDKELPLILTPDQYIEHRENRNRLFNRLEESSYEQPIVFVGFSFADADIRFTLKHLEKIGNIRPRSYMVGPNITDAEQRLWDLKKISTIKLSFKDFMQEIKSCISENERILSTIIIEKPTHLIMSRFLSGVASPSERLIKFLDNDVVYIHADLPEKNTSPQEFYKGYFDGWDPIIKNYDVERNIKDSILSEVFLIEENQRISQQELYLIKGNAGSGKTVLLHRLAWDAAVIYERLCLYYKTDNKIEYDRLSELFLLSKERIYLFVDNITERTDDIEYILTRAKKDNVLLTIISAERVNIWNVNGERLSGYLTRDYTLQYLKDKEIEKLIELLTKYKSLGYLQGKTNDQQKEALSEKAGRELLVALYEATAGKPFADIVMDEYNSIPNEEAKNLYLSICIFHRIGSYARAGIISRLHGINFTYFKEHLFKPLESVVYHKRNYEINDFVFCSRHQYIAELVFEQVLVDLDARHNRYVNIISKLDIDYDSDRQVFTALINARSLLSIFKDVLMIRSIYKTAYRNVGEIASVMQQESIFEMNAEGGNLEKASLLLDRAHEIDPQNGFIAHSKAEFLYKKAEKSNQKLVINNLLLSAKEICNDIISNKRSKNIVHAYHTLLKICLLELKNSINDLSDTIEIKIQQFEKTLNKAKLIYPKESFFHDAEASFNKLINNTPRALESLKAAFATNIRSPYLATRLCNYYIEEGLIEEGLSVLDTALAENENDKDLNYKYAKLLAEKAPERNIDLKHYLRKSFTKGDKRYDQQFWYARCLYLLGEKEPAMEYFNYLKEVALDVRIKRKLHGHITDDGKNKVYEGTITKIENSFGFIKKDFTGDSLYFSRHIPDSIRYNSRVKFNIAFNYNGPIAEIIE
ncbi:P-loop NTPase [Flavobacterium sp. W20_MBD1_R3]|uniref:P-loop NTPase n=1 Tax=Flavobacterium sp. W20_MBD1_R3 TaxID=3240278 RepID=UPI003F8F91A8